MRVPVKIELGSSGPALALFVTVTQDGAVGGLRNPHVKDVLGGCVPLAFAGRDLKVPVVDLTRGLDGEWKREGLAVANPVGALTAIHDPRVVVDVGIAVDEQRVGTVAVRGEVCGIGARVRCTGVGAARIGADAGRNVVCDPGVRVIERRPRAGRGTRVAAEVVVVVNLLRCAARGEHREDGEPSGQSMHAGYL